MSWQQRIAGAMVIVLVGLPTAAMFCALRCDLSARSVAVHHGNGQTCDEPAPEYAGSQISVGPMHDCSSHGLLRQPMTTVTERADIIAKPVTSVIATIHISIRPLENAQSNFVADSPPGTAAPTIRVVLRI